MNLEYRLAMAETELESLIKLREMAERKELQARQIVQILRSKIALKVEVSNDD